MEHYALNKFNTLAGRDEELVPTGTPSYPDHPARVNTTETQHKEQQPKEGEEKTTLLIHQVINIHA